MAKRIILTDEIDAQYTKAVDVSTGLTDASQKINGTLDQIKKSFGRSGGETTIITSCANMTKAVDQCATMFDEGARLLDDSRKAYRNLDQTIRQEVNSTEYPIANQLTYGDAGSGQNVRQGYYIDVPLHGQEYNYTCGAASGVMVLAALGITVSEHDFATKAETYIDGQTYVYKLRNALNSYVEGSPYHYNVTAGISTNEYKDLMVQSLEKGHPVVVNVGIPAGNKGAFGYSADGHYVVVTGVTETADGKTMISINDPFSPHGTNSPQMIEMTLEELHYYNSRGNGYSIFG